VSEDPLDPEAYRHRAALLRERAQTSDTVEDKERLLSVAKMFDDLAEKIERIGQAIKDDK
jgi:hypothetical protein